MFYRIKNDSAVIKQLGIINMLLTSQSGAQSSFSSLKNDEKKKCQSTDVVNILSTEGLF